MDYLRRARRSRTAAGLTAVAVLMLFSFSVRAQPQERSVSPATPPAGNAESGKKLYNSVGCWTCHGYSGQGARTGARLAPNPLPFPIFVRYIVTVQGVSRFGSRDATACRRRWQRIAAVRYASTLSCCS